MSMEIWTITVCAMIVVAWLAYAVDTRETVRPWSKRNLAPARRAVRVYDWERDGL